eukprot:9500506-Pyramimonas_sp.AAC.4
MRIDAQQKTLTEIAPIEPARNTCTSGCARVGEVTAPPLQHSKHVFCSYHDCSDCNLMRSGLWCEGHL